MLSKSAVSGVAALLRAGGTAALWLAVVSPATPPVQRTGSLPSGNRDLAPGAPLATTALPPSAIRRLEATWQANDPATRDHTIQETMADLVLADGGSAAARRWLDGIPPGEKRETLLQSFEFAWFGTDPDAALAWAAHLRDADERSEALARMLIVQASSDPLRAVENAQRLDATRDDGLLDNLVQTWAAQDLPAAQQWALALPPGESRDRSVARTALVQARSFPPDAARFAVAALPPGPVLDEAVVSIVHQWAMRAPAAAQAWVDTFSPGELRERTLREIAGAGTALP